MLYGVATRKELLGFSFGVHGNDVGFVCDLRQVEVMVRATWTSNMGRVKFIFIRTTRRLWDGNDFLFIDDVR